MQVKKFEAPNLEEALKVIKRELGPEAIILSTKENRKAFGLLKRPSIEVTAAISDQALLKKKIAESKMKADVKEKVQASKASTQALTYDRFAKKAKDVQPESQRNRDNQKNQEHLAKFRKPAQKKYVDIQDTDDDRDIYTPHQQLTPVARQVLPPQQVQIPSQQRQPLTTPAQTPQYQASTPNSMMQGELPGDIALLREHLMYVGVHPDIATQIVKVVHGDNEVWKAIRRESLSTQMRNLIPVVLNYIRIGRPITDTQSAGRKIYSFVGPTGSGKTTTIAKLAGRIKLQRTHRIGLISTDIFRVGGSAQLKTYADALGVPMVTASTAAEVMAVINHQLRDCDLILIDTPGASELDVEKLSYVQQTLEQLGEAPRFLVTGVNQPAPLRRLIENASRFGGLRFDGHIFTKLDETDSRGDILNRAYCSKRPVFYLSTGQKVPEDITVATRESIGRFVFHQYAWEST